MELPHDDGVPGRAGERHPGSIGTAAEARPVAGLIAPLLEQARPGRDRRECGQQ